MKYTAVIFDFEGTLIHGDKIYSDARNLILQLRESGVALGIASNTSTHSIKERLEKNRMLQYFDTIVGIDSVAYVGKPAPDVFIKAAENLAYPSDACLVIEDSESGVEGAYQAGMDVVLIRGKKHTRALLECHDLEADELHKIIFG